MTSISRPTRSVDNGSRVLGRICQINAGTSNQKGSALARLEEIYAAYLDCLNRQNWERLGEFVGDEVEHNGRKLGLSGYREMLVNDYLAIPDLRFDAELLVCNGSILAARLQFDCSPRADFLGLPINGKRVKFSEHAFYEFKSTKISRVWSVIDKSEIERQLEGQ